MTGRNQQSNRQLNPAPRSSRASSYSRPQDQHLPNMRSVQSIPSVSSEQAAHYSRSNSNDRYSAKKKMSTRKKVVLSLVGVFAVALIGVGISLVLYVNSLNDAMSFDDKEEEMVLREALAPVASSGDPYYMLLLGSDARTAGEAARSDVAILLRVDPAKGQLTMISIPRDTKVEIEGYGTQKINAALAFGGPALAVKTVSEFAGVPISHYAEIDFGGIESLVDKLGGITLTIPEAIYDENLGASLPVGEQTLNGTQALIFARSRAYADGDFTRTSNQRILLTAIIQKVLSLPLLELPGAIQNLAECITTDYKVGELFPLAQQFQGSVDREIYSSMVPSSTDTIDGISYVITDETAWAEMMKLVDSGQDPATLLSNYI